MIASYTPRKPSYPWTQHYICWWPTKVNIYIYWTGTGRVNLSKVSYLFPFVRLLVGHPLLETIFVSVPDLDFLQSASTRYPSSSISMIMTTVIPAQRFSVPPSCERKDGRESWGLAVYSIIDCWSTNSWTPRKFWDITSLSHCSLRVKLTCCSYFGVNCNKIRMDGLVCSPYKSWHDRDLLATANKSSINMM